MKQTVQIMIKKDFPENFRVFKKENQIYVQWDFIADPQLEGWGWMTEASMHPTGDVKTDIRHCIALRYDIEDEMAIERQKETKYDEWKEHYDFCEEIKKVIKSN